MKRLVFLLLALFLTALTNAQKAEVSPKLINRLTTKPEFEGGGLALMKYLQKNIQYPQLERDNDIQGKVVLRFMVDTAGLIQDIKVLKSVSPGINKEAVRVVKQMPKWKPATYHGKPVPVYYILPVGFRLQ